MVLPPHLFAVQIDLSSPPSSSSSSSFSSSSVSSSLGSTSGKHIVVIGAGIVGCSTAYHLALRGASVTVIERKKVGAAASGKAGGFLARNWGDGASTQFLHRHGFDLHRELATKLNLTSWRQIPTLSITRETWGNGKKDGSEAAWLGSFYNDEIR
mmetsp:Transcript_29016/g.46608  ORF Transcript_29016/g.46608 Transcript_29016/m.46608 type:complete len:155 (-) Transcript_29016:157-621(-)